MNPPQCYVNVFLITKQYNEMIIKDLHYRGQSD